ncbi:hypothetical protein XHV734_1745 [Xanthomonas hortorum pv. vitians]|nr:hypothetical protein XHV734_1745 [Xanthomonas hortorum pv. vitians]
MCLFFNKVHSNLSGAVSSPIAGPCGGMDTATEPPGMDSRRPASGERTAPSTFEALLHRDGICLRPAIAAIESAFKRFC